MPISDSGRPVAGSLRPVAGRRLGELAPRCRSLAAVGDDFHIVAVNGAGDSAKAMAAELCRPASDMLHLELRCTSCLSGILVQVEKLHAGHDAALDVLRGLSFELPAGSMGVLVGSVGSGQSIALQCILGLVQARRGRVALNGLDVAALAPAALRSMTGFVPQESFVFAGSWRMNLDPLGHYPDARLWEALEAARLDSVVRAVPAGLDGATGPALSGAQFRALGLARVVLQQPPLVLVDGPGLQQDCTSLEQLRLLLRAAFGRSTVLVAAGSREATAGFDIVVDL